LAVQGGADPLSLSARPVSAIADVFDLTGAAAVAPPALSATDPTTTLASARTSGQATLPLIQTLGVGTYPFDVLVDTGIRQEVMTVTGLSSGTTYAVTRGAAGTTAASHNANAPVTQALDPTLYEWEPAT